MASAGSDGALILKILHVYKTYLPEDFTGVPRVIHSIAESLAGRGFESHVLALTSGPASAAPLQVGQHTVHQVRRAAKIASTDLSLRLFGVFRELAEECDVLHYHFPWPLADLLHLLYGRRRPSVVTYHSDIIKQRELLKLYSPLMHRFLNSVDAIVATSPNYAQSSSVLSGHSSKLSVIPIGIGARQLPDVPLVQMWRDRVGEGFCLFVGAPRYYKGLPMLIAAARLSGLPVVIAGGGTPDFDLGTLPNNVKFLGAVEEMDKEALLQLCAAFVFPSHLRSEAFGVALLEAARAGKPMISCEIGTGTTYVNLNGETGIAVPPNDAAALAGAMVRITTDPDLANSMGQSAMRRFQSCFTAEAAGTAYMELYRRIAS